MQLSRARFLSSERRMCHGASRYDLDLSLAGEHQLENAATAVRAAELLVARYPAIDAAAIARGVAAARWPGRLEAFRLAATGTTVLLDAAHNPDGCAALARFLVRLGRPYDLLFGCLADKEPAARLPPLAADARRVLLTRPGSPRALAPEALAAFVPAGTACDVIADPRQALAAALAPAPDLLVVAGSIYLVGELLEKLRAGREAFPRWR